MIAVYILTVVALFLLYYAANSLISVVLQLGSKLAINPKILGLTFLAFATSAPELLVSFEAALSGLTLYSYGNIIGSNILNILIAAGILHIFAPNLDTQVNKTDLLFLILISVLFLVLITFFAINIFTALLLIITLIAYIMVGYHNNKAYVPSYQKKTDSSLIKILIFGVFAILVMILGTYLFIDCTMIISKDLGINEKWTGLYIAAIGTSLPELSVTIVSAFKKQIGLAMHNILGSNIMNFSLIPATLGLFETFNGGLLFQLDIILYGIALALFTTFAIIIPKTHRSIGLLFIMIYLGYIITNT